jgi:hypothetical protein
LTFETFLPLTEVLLAPLFVLESVAPPTEFFLLLLVVLGNFSGTRSAAATFLLDPLDPLDKGL